MKANTALLFVLSGLALLAAGAGPAVGRWRRAGQGAAGLVVLGGGLTLVEYLAGWDLGLDQLVFRQPAAAGLLYPGRMVPSVAWNFVLLGVALLLLNRWYLLRRAVAIVRRGRRREQPVRQRPR